jgi:hypothetical protein
MQDQLAAARSAAKSIDAELSLNRAGHRAPHEEFVCRP